MSVFARYAAYYDLLYKDKEYAREADYIGALVRRFHPPAKTVLELGCGTGKHARLLARQGFAVTGVDMSEEMLETARRGESVAPNPEPGYSQGDIRTYRNGKTFDAVISLFHVFSYQTTDKDIGDAFATAAAHLEPGGLLLFDTWYGPAVLTDPPATRVKRLEDASIQVTRLAEAAHDANRNTVRVDYDVFVRDKKSGSIEEIRESHHMRYFFLPEIERLAREAGLELIHSEAWLTGKTPGTDTWGVCFCARKPAGRR